MEEQWMSYKKEQKKYNQNLSSSKIPSSFYLLLSSPSPQKSSFSPKKSVFLYGFLGLQSCASTKHLFLFDLEENGLETLFLQSFVPYHGLATECIPQ